MCSLSCGTSGQTVLVFGFQLFFCSSSIPTLVTQICGVIKVLLPGLILCWQWINVNNINPCNFRSSGASLISNYAKVVTLVTVHTWGNDQFRTNLTTQNLVVSIPLVCGVEACIIHLYKKACWLAVYNLCALGMKEYSWLDDLTCIERNWNILNSIPSIVGSGLANNAYRFVYLCEYSPSTAETCGRLIPAWVRMVWRVLLSPPFLCSRQILSSWKACSSGWWKCMRHCTTSLVLTPRNRASRLQLTVCFATCWPTSRRKRSVTGRSVKREGLLTFVALLQVGYIQLLSIVYW